MAVKKELQKIPGVQVEDVQIGHARVSFDESRTSEKVLSTAIEDAGYAIVR
jgi:copper chaperone CopZ